MADSGTCALTMLDERAAWRRPLSWLSENPPLLSAEVNKRPNNTRVKAIESFFAKWSLIGPFFLVDQSYDFGGDYWLTHNSTFKSFSWKWTTWKKWPLPKLQLWERQKTEGKKRISTELYPSKATDNWRHLSNSKKNTHGKGSRRIIVLRKRTEFDQDLTVLQFHLWVPHGNLFQ